MRKKNIVPKNANKRYGGSEGGQAELIDSKIQVKNPAPPTASPSLLPVIQMMDSLFFL